MNDIIKVILLNIILIYFLIKKNKSISMFLIVVLFMYLLYLRGNKLLEGQGFIEEKKDEVKFMKMANLDRLLEKLYSFNFDSACSLKVFASSKSFLILSSLISILPFIFGIKIFDIKM